MGFSEFLDTYLAHIIGVVALVQVWLIAAYKKWILKGKIEFHPSANMEIGFSSFGSTVSLPGALRASEKDAFVTQMRLTIIRESDRAQHNFSWRVFKSSSISMDTLAPENIEIATGFIVPTNVPRPIHVFFASENFTQQYAQDADELRSSWLLFGQHKLHELGETLKAQIQDPAFVDALFREFGRESVPVDFYTRLNHGFFWHAGNYCIELDSLFKQGLWLLSQVYQAASLTSSHQVSTARCAALKVRCREARGTTAVALISARPGAGCVHTRGCRTAPFAVPAR